MWYDPASPASSQPEAPPEGNPPFGIGELLAWGEHELSFLEGGEARASAQRLMEHALGEDRAALYRNRGDRVSGEILRKFRRLIFLRQERRPTAYLTGKAFFWNEVLEVTEACLIPRPETEMLVEVLGEVTGYQGGETFSFLDLGTGSGAIGISILKNYRSARGTLADISEEALEVVRRNLAAHGLSEQAETVRSDLFEVFGQRTEKPAWDVMVSNPPYLSRYDLERLQPEVAFEPRIALDGGEDGLDFYRRISREAGQYLNSGGRLLLEVGIGQSGAVSDLLKQNGFAGIQLKKDYQGIERVVTARKSS